MRWPNHNPLPEQAACLPSASHVFLTGLRGLVARVWSLTKIGKSTSFIKIDQAEIALPKLEEPEAWGTRLHEEKDFLLSLVRGMEAEFLITGGGLMVLARQLNEIQKECQSLTDLTLGRSPDAAVQFGFQLLKKAEDLVLASYDQYDHVFTTLAELQHRLARLANHHHYLMEVLVPLNFITTLLRIEASRHPVEVQDVFFTLAATVNQTVKDVRVTLERQFAELALSQQVVEKLLTQVSAPIKQHRKTVSGTLANSRRQLHALSQELISASAGASGLAEHNQAVKRHIGGMVMAQQCQDITRQKIEHVGEAMDEMCTHLDDNAAPPAEARQFIYQAAKIQLQQTQAVFSELERAAGSLKSGIQGLRTDAGSAATAAVKLGGTLLEAKIAGHCQAGMGKIFTIVQEVVQTTANILSAIEPLQARFLNCTQKATTLANDVRYIALNAQVFAIHVTDAAALEVLAGRMRMISDETMLRVSELGSELQDTAEMVSNLRQRLLDFQELSHLEQKELAAESVLSQKKLSELEGNIPVLIQRAAGQQETFARSVEGVLLKIQFPATVAEASVRSIGFFHDLVAWGGKGISDSQAETGASRKIDQLKSKYTMASERQTHATALQPANRSGGQPPIDLFGDPELPRTAELLVVNSVHSAPFAEHSGVTNFSESNLSAPMICMPAEKSSTSADLADNVDLF
jgi:hypothetical protein